MQGPRHGYAQIVDDRVAPRALPELLVLQLVDGAVQLGPGGPRVAALRLAVHSVYQVAALRGVVEALQPRELSLRLLRGSQRPEHHPHWPGGPRPPRRVGLVVAQPVAARRDVLPQGEVVAVPYVPHRLEGLHRPVQDPHQQQPDGQPVGDHEARAVVNAAPQQQRVVAVGQELLPELGHAVKHVGRALGVRAPIVEASDALLLGPHLRVQPDLLKIAKLLLPNLDFDVDRHHLLFWQAAAVHAQQGLLRPLEGGQADEDGLRAHDAPQPLGRLPGLLQAPRGQLEQAVALVGVEHLVNIPLGLAVAQQHHAVGQPLPEEPQPPLLQGEDRLVQAAGLHRGQKSRLLGRAGRADAGAALRWSGGQAGGSPHGHVSTQSW
mmetsp:Transcript_102279/g.285617  ORF Transcript_102279/g.285617 Transcript_102279/m.285617 type:complete len:379 (+) Transcript_102279:556-1692(+)